MVSEQVWLGSCPAASLVVAKLAMAVGAAALVKLSVSHWARPSAQSLALPLEILYVVWRWLQLLTALCVAAACAWQPKSWSLLLATK